PENWHVAYAIDESDVFATVDAGMTWRKITGSLVTGTVNNELQSIEFVKLPASTTSTAADVLLVGGRDGIFRALNPGGVPANANYQQAAVADLQWVEFGKDLPNVPVTDIRYIRPITSNGHAAGDVLVIATLGRGVWKIDNGSAY